MRVGDRVIRIASDHLGMQVGDMATVLAVTREGIVLEEYQSGPGGKHAPSYLKVISELEYHIRKVQNEQHTNIEGIRTKSSEISSR